ncbi:MAG: 50S ribosomal protein L11 methyltransferase [Chloroflexota bacterium]
MEWLELSCKVDREAAEPVGELFARHGRGVAVEEDVNAIEGEEVLAPSPFVFVRTYLALDDSAAAKQQEIERGLWVLGIIRPVGPLETRRLVEQDWAEAWKEHFHVHRVGRRLVIKPSWREYAPAPDELIIALDPGMAFGTGLHPTTQLCMRALEDTIAGGEKVLDLGTGSGILAIAAVRLGATSALALDTDPVAVEVAAANVAANGLADRIAVGQGSLPMTSPRAFPVVVANIIARVIAVLAGELAAALTPGGTLIASGIIAERELEVVTALKASGFALVNRMQDGDWVALIAHR